MGHGAQGLGEGSRQGRLNGGELEGRGKGGRREGGRGVGRGLGQRVSYARRRRSMRCKRGNAPHVKPNLLLDKTSCMAVVTAVRTKCSG